MKIYKLGSLTTLLISTLILGLVVFLPIVLIEALWNSTIGKSFNNVNIDFWQASILWLIILVILNILGLFKFEFAIEAGDTLDKEFFKKKLQNLQNKPKENTKVKNEAPKDQKD